MAEVGCLKDGHFQNLVVENTTIFETDNMTVSSLKTFIYMFGENSEFNSLFA